MRRRPRSRLSAAFVWVVAVLALGGASASPLKVGSQAPLFTLPTLEGSPFNLKDERGHKPVLLTFFTAVGPAGWMQSKDFMAAIDVESTYPSYIRVIGVAVGNEKKEFNQLRYPGIIETPLLLAKGLDDPAVKAYGITETPASFLFDENGVLVGVYLKYKELMPAVKDLLGTRWQDQAFVFKDYGSAPDVALEGHAGFKNVKTAPQKPTVYLFWAAASYPSESSLTGLNSVVSANPEFDFVAATFSPPKLVSKRVDTSKLKNLALTQYSSKANTTLFGKSDAIFPFWMIVNTKGSVIYRGVGPLTSNEVRDLLAKARAYLRGG